MESEKLGFRVSLTLGRMLRAATYSKVRIVTHDGQRQVRKHRTFYAPLLVWLGEPLAKMLDTGVRVLPQRDWEERERLIYERLYVTSIHVDGDGVLVMPRLPGATLATLLEDPQLEDADRAKAIELAVVALARFHDAGFTHGDAMAENVMVDLDAAVARWFDFETVHDSRRPTAWRRADDVRALLVTCVLRAVPGTRAETLALVLDVYADQDVTRLVARNFASLWRRPLTFHLAQAAVPFECFVEIGRLLRERLGD